MIGRQTVDQASYSISCGQKIRTVDEPVVRISLLRLSAPELIHTLRQNDRQVSALFQCRHRHICLVQSGHLRWR
jgi:hypothetical protein